MEIADWFLHLGEHYPDLVALVVGTLVGYVFTAMLERYFFPMPIDPIAKRRLQGLTFILCWLSSGTASAILWVAIDPQDPLSVRLSVSYVVSILSFAGYPFLAKVATGIFPKIGTAWSKDEP